ncbi:MAG: HAMP domain-containing histidine kinase [Chitinophagaceae bacterium]|nr:HAMP domain-containing histidine kinase [Chitinophagaceae bacterium]MCZ2396161.1 HAMP domain-containing histidine kinase [Chitinophagales bacterium]
MTRKVATKLLLDICLLSLFLIGAAYGVIMHEPGWVVFMIPLTLIQVYRIFRKQRRIYDEFAGFVDSIRFKDFSRHFSIKKSPAEMLPFRQGFNELYDTFRETGKEREMQYQYLQKTLEMVNTGILSYDPDSGEIIWFNNSLKQMLRVPYLKTISGLEMRHKELYDDIMRLSPGESKMSNLYFGPDAYKILLSATAFKTGDKRFILLGVQNISSAVDETESEAWRKLLRVMTHEIMNSVAPISSLAGTLQQILRKDADGAAISGIDGYDDLVVGVNTIKSRSESLLRFAETYRSLNKIAAPEIKKFHVLDLFENISNLMDPTLAKKGIELEMILKEPDMLLMADSTLIEQVLINLVLNSMEAVKDSEEKRISLSAEDINGRVVLKVSDTGAGMSKEVLDKIFIPFFTTKKTGSGIGLSLSRQIMKLHGGSLSVYSEEGKGTAFTLHFP